MRKTNVACQIAYDLGLLLAALILILAPIHHTATGYAPIIETLDPTHVLAGYPGAKSLSPGDRFPLYRFGGNSISQIGEGEVESSAAEQVVFRYDPLGIRFGMGRNGSITNIKGNQVTVNLGSSAPFLQGQAPLRAGDGLIVFKDLHPVAAIQLTSVGPNQSVGELVKSTGRIEAGLPVSEYTVPTEFVIFDNPAIGGLEIALVLVLLAGYGAGWAWFKKSPLVELGSRSRRYLAKPGGKATFRLGRDILLGPPFAWLIGRFTVVSVPYLIEAVLPALSKLLHRPLAPESLHIPEFADLLERGSFVFYGMAALCYYVVLARTRTSPLLLLWRKISFRGGPLKTLPPSLARDLATWMLHLVIAYAFAYSLLGFVQANLNDAIGVAWPHSQVRITGGFDIKDPAGSLEFFRTAFVAIAYMVSHTPAFFGVEAFFITIRDILFTLTIVGCLFGYGHSIFGYLWGKKIRNLDFTIPGWVTNAACYGPLLGYVVGRMVPSSVGTYPLFGSGPIQYIDLGVELFLNLVYMLTIWNLGKMFGVMTDKGVRTTGFYSVVRHPSYTAEALMFLALFLKAFSSPIQWLAAGFVYLVTYWLRSEREDDFMSNSNPDFKAYAQATPFKFIPGVY